jgi:hypothetical protein
VGNQNDTFFEMDPKGTFISGKNNSSALKSDIHYSGIAKSQVLFFVEEDTTIHSYCQSFRIVCECWRLGTLIIHREFII